jgi:hypothetical protein
MAAVRITANPVDSLAHFRRRHWCADDREPGSPRAGVGAVVPGRLQEWHAICGHSCEMA